MFVSAPFFTVDREEYSTLFPTPVLNIPSRRGYTLLQAHHKSDSNIYSEVYKLAKAYYYEIQKEVKFKEALMKAENSFGLEELMSTFYAHLPLLVIDAPLVEVYLDEAGDTKIEEKDISSIRIKIPWKLLDKDHDPDEGLSIVIITNTKLHDGLR